MSSIHLTQKLHSSHEYKGRNENLTMDLLLKGGGGRVNFIGWRGEERGEREREREVRGKKEGGGGEVRRIIR